MFDTLWRYTKPARLWDLYTFICGPSEFGNDNPKLRLMSEYCRLLGVGSFHTSTFEDGLLSMSNDCWRITTLNSSYTLCATYPFALIVPKSIRYLWCFMLIHVDGFGLMICSLLMIFSNFLDSKNNAILVFSGANSALGYVFLSVFCFFDTSDEEVLQASTFRARCRLPVISWRHPGTSVEDAFFIIIIQCAYFIASFSFPSSPCVYVYKAKENFHGQFHFWKLCSGTKSF